MLHESILSGANALAKSSILQVLSSFGIPPASAPDRQKGLALPHPVSIWIATFRALLRNPAQLAFLRDERDFLNPTLAELPRGDFAVTTLRNFALELGFDTFVIPNMNKPKQAIENVKIIGIDRVDEAIGWLRG